MAVLLDKDTTVLVQGITGREGSVRAQFMATYGTTVVAGVSPGQGGSHVANIPVFNTVKEAWHCHGPIDATVTFVPGPLVKEAVIDALEAGVKLVFMPVERVPLHDTLEMLAHARQAGARIVGPGSFGVISPGRAVVGWIGGSAEFANEVFVPGRVGVISRSGGQTATLAWIISRVGLGTSTAVHTGSEPVVGTTAAELLQLFEADPETDAVVLLGEIGTVAEEEAAEVIAAGGFTKPLVAYIAGEGAKPGTRFSHASAIVEGRHGSAEKKIEALRGAGARVVQRPEDIGRVLSDLVRPTAPS